MLHNRGFFSLSASAWAIAASALLAAPAQAADADAGAPADANTDIVVTAQRLDAAREYIKPSLGASTYTLDAQAIQNLPGSDNQPIQDIILQMPGVSQDQFGQFHVRDEHNGVQYRVNGVIIPESIAVFGQALSPRLIDSISLVTGTLPAQYGLRTAGIIDLTTKSGLKNGGEASIYGGSHDTIEPSLSFAGSSGATTYFITGSYKHSNLGIDNVNSTRTAVHDKTEQFNGFGYIDHILGANDRIAFTGGYTSQHYQIPNPAGPTDIQLPDPTQQNGLFDINGNPVVAGGTSSFDSANLNETQLQTFGFGALSWLHSAGPFSFQASAFARLATLDYRPDYAGELLFNGLAQAASKKDFTAGGQFDGAYKLNGQHTLRFGGLIGRDRSHSFTQTSVFQTDGDVYDPVNGYSPGNILAPLVPGGNTPLSSFPFTTVATQWTYSAYLQDEWHITPQVVFNFGARFDENDAVRHERQLSPRANLVWTPNKGLTIHAGYARYFAPAPFELIANSNIAQYYGTSSTPSVRTNDATYAQRENYFDAGIQQRIGHLTLGLDGYYRRDTHLVDEGQFGAPIILTPFNYAKGRLFGIELSATYHQGGFSAYGNFAYQKAQGINFVSNEFNFGAAEVAYVNTHYIYLDHDQTWTSSAGASYRWSDGALACSRISADMVFGSGLRTDGDPLPAPYNINVPNGGALPSYATFNLSVGHKFEKAGLDVRVDVENLFDKIYEIRDGQGVGVGAPSYGPRRGVFVGFTKSL